jgi:hypothetical protein
LDILPAYGLFESLYDLAKSIYSTLVDSYISLYYGIEADRSCYLLFKKGLLLEKLKLFLGDLP